ncbi:MAG: hypothetical protein KDC33_09245 [Thermoleophilia bacterium]|nr:hypothetical protein [Thermoleophilia bacterium]
MADYDRAVTGADAVAAARRALGPDAAERLALRVAPGAALAGTEDLEALAPPRSLGVGRGAWLAAFTPLFGEFE